MSIDTQHFFNITRIVAFTFILLVLTTAAIAARGDDRLSEEELFSLAVHFFKNKDYGTAAVELNKFLYLFPDSENAEKAKYLIGVSYFNNKNYSKALNHFFLLLDKKSISQYRTECGFMISRSYQRMNNYQAAIDNLYSLLQLSDNVFIKDDIYYYLGWLYLEIGSFKEAQSAFALISKNKTDFQTEKLNERIADSESIRRKSPVTAGFLSMFPGAGYLYCNRYRDAGVSFLITGATAVGAYECFDKELYALGGILSLASLGFYAGSIYGSITSAHKFNTMEQKEFVRDLQREFKPGLWIDKNKNLLIGMTYRF